MTTEGNSINYADILKLVKVKEGYIPTDWTKMEVQIECFLSVVLLATTALGYLLQLLVIN